MEGNRGEYKRKWEETYSDEILVTKEGDRMRVKENEGSVQRNRGEIDIKEKGDRRRVKGSEGKIKENEKTDSDKGQ